MKLYNLKHGNFECDSFFGTPNTRRPYTDRPYVWNFVEMACRATRVRIGAFAAHLIQTPSLTMTCVAIDLNEVTRVKMCPPRTMLVNVAIEGKLRSSLFIGFRERSI